MRLLSLEIHDFRNIARASLEPSPRATILVGPNGQGKTNLLEAIYLLATLKPLRASRLAELVRFGGSMARVEGRFEGPGGSRTVAVEIVPGARTAFLDGKPQERLDAYFEGLAAVCFSPDDLLLVKGGPEGRRRFLDRAAFNRWPAVLGEAREYVRALRERNAALRTAGPDVEESFRGPLVRAAARLLARRHGARGRAGPACRTGLRRDLAERAPRQPGSPTGRPRGCGSREARKRWPRASPRSWRCGSRATARRATPRPGRTWTTSLLALDGRGARPYGSQGQQRALVLALKIAEIENLRAVLGRPPLLLLDDVSSELDPEKNELPLALPRDASRRRRFSPRPTGGCSSRRPVRTRPSTASRAGPSRESFPESIPDT